MKKVGADFTPSEKKDNANERPVFWVTKLGELNKLASTFISYGNGAVLTHLYMVACLLVDIGPVEKRQISGN